MNDLVRNVIRTVPVEHIIDKNSPYFINSWSFIGNDILFKPSLSGKGFGLIKSSEFANLNEFTSHI